MPGPFGPGYPTIDLRPPDQCRVLPGNLGGSDLCRHGMGSLPPAYGTISGQPSGNSPDNRRVDPSRAFPTFHYFFTSTRDFRDATGGSLPSGGIPSKILCRGGHPGQNNISRVMGVPGECHQNGPHTSACTLEMVGFIQRDMQ